MIREKGRVLISVLAVAFALLVAGALWMFTFGIEYAYMPPMSKVANPERIGAVPAYDLWGEELAPNDARLAQEELSDALLSPQMGAVRIDEDMLELGREAFYKETFNNEVFFTDILGGMDGPINFRAMGAAIIRLRGRGTDNLQVRLAEDALVGGRQFRQGELVDTGLNVAAGSFAVVGSKVTFKRGRLRMGLTCAACHTGLDQDTGHVIEGAPNINLNVGLLIALASNSTAYFANAELSSLQPFQRDSDRRIKGSDGQYHILPDIAALEDAVERIFLSWPPGNFDSMNDLRATPTSIPDSFTRDDHPYGWPGFAYAGPFRGLSVLNNNVHGLNADKLADREAFHTVHNIDRELYVATILQNAADPTLRYNPDEDGSPIEFIARAGPNPEQPIGNEVVRVPTYPKASFLTPDGFLASSPGFAVWEQINAISAFQNTLSPPYPKEEQDPEILALGEAVFTQAACVGCHDGPAYSNNRIIPLAEIGTEPVRSQALAAFEPLMQPPVMLAFDESVPLEHAPRYLDVPMTEEEVAEANLAWAIRGTSGGYKVKGLVGLQTSPPYLHDGGVAVGPDPETQIGVPGTHHIGVTPDAYQSLRAMVDRQLRERVIEANAQDEGLRRVNVRGIGHEFWVDETAGFSADEQDALIRYLLQLRHSDSSGASLADG